MRFQGAFETSKEFHRRLREESFATEISIFISSIDDQVDTQQYLRLLLESLNAIDAIPIKFEMADETLPSGHRKVTRKAFLRAPLKSQKK